LLTGENDQPLAMADISIESPVQDFAIETAIQDDILQTNQSESIVSDTMPVDPIQESFKNVDAQPVGPDPTQGQNNQTVPPTLQRDTDPSVRFTQGQNISIEENPEATIVSSTIIKKAHNWLYVIILVILVATTVGLLLLILHALNVYDALSIDTPVWADGILLWIQGLFGR